MVVRDSTFKYCVILDALCVSPGGHSKNLQHIQGKEMPRLTFEIPNHWRGGAQACLLNINSIYIYIQSRDNAVNIEMMWSRQTVCKVN